MTVFRSPNSRMKPLLVDLLITLLAIGVYQGASVGAQNVLDQIAQETRVSRAAVQTVEPPKLVTVKPESPKKHGDNAKLRKVHYVPPHILKHQQQQHLNMIHNKIKNNYQHKKAQHQKAHHTKQYPSHMHLRPPPMYVPVHTPAVGRGQVTQNKQYAATAPRPVVVVGKPTTYPAPALLRPLTPALTNVTSTTTPTTTTTLRPRRVKRIWPKDMISNATTKDNTLTVKTNSSVAANLTTSTSNSTVVSLEVAPAASNRIRHYLPSYASKTTTTTTTQPPKKAYTRHQRKPRPQASTEQPTTVLQTDLHTDSNDWIPMVPRNYPRTRRGPPPARRTATSPILVPPHGLTRRATLLQTYGLVPLHQVGHNFQLRTPAMFYPKKRKRLNSNIYSGFSGGLQHSNDLFNGFSDVGELQPAESHYVLTKIKHHHHHHHHKYVKTVEKPVKVPFKVEITKPYVVEKKVPYPVEKIVHKIIEKKVPVPYTIEKKVPYPVEVKVPQPYPVKVIQKQYVPKPYAVIHKVPVVKHVEKKVPYPVPVTVEKNIPYPVEVKVPVTVEKHITVEKKVPVPYPVKVYVPQPVPVEKRVPFPVEVKVKEPYPVIKHIQVPVPVKVFVDKPYPVKVPHPYPVTVEKRVPYPVEVEKRIPVPVKVYVPHPVPVEKPVPVYVHRHEHAHAHAHLPPADGHEVTVHGNGNFQGFPEGSHSSSQ